MEGVTFTLQIQSKAAKARLEGSTTSDMNTSSISLNTEQPSITSSVELPTLQQVVHDKDPQSSSSHPRESPHSWVEQFTEQNSSTREEPIAREVPRDLGSPTSSSGAHLSDSITSASVSLMSGSDGAVRIPVYNALCRLPKNILQMMESLHSTQSESSESQTGAGVEGPPMSTKSKGELWREVKVLSMFSTPPLYQSPMRLPFQPLHGH